MILSDVPVRRNDKKEQEEKYGGRLLIIKVCRRIWL